MFCYVFTKQNAEKVDNYVLCTEVLFLFTPYQRQSESLHAVFGFILIPKVRMV